MCGHCILRNGTQPSIWNDFQGRKDVKQVWTDAKSSKEELGLLWYGTGHWMSANIVEKGIGVLSTSYMPREYISRYKKFSILTPNIKLALDACVKSCHLETEERLYLILCNASPKLMKEVIDEKIDKIPNIHFDEIDGNIILAIFISKYPSTGELQDSYIFSEAWGAPKWKAILEEQASEAGIRIVVSSPTQPKYEYTSR